MHSAATVLRTLAKCRGTKVLGTDEAGDEVDLKVFKKASELLTLWMQRLDGTDHRLDHMDVANLSWAFSVRGADSAHDLAFFETLVVHFTSSLDRAAYTAHSFSNVVWALAKLLDRNDALRARLGPLPLFKEELLSRASVFAEKYVQSFRPQELASTVRAFGCFGGMSRWRSFFLVAVARVRQKLQTMSLDDQVRLALAFQGLLEASPIAPQELSLSSGLLSCHAELHKQAQYLVNTVAELGESRLEEFSPGELAALLGAAAKSHSYTGRLWAMALQRVGRKDSETLDCLKVPRPSWGLEEVARLLCAVAKLYGSHALEHRSRPAIKAQDLSGVVRTDFVPAIMKLLTVHNLRGLCHHTVAEVAWALGTLAEQDPDLKLYFRSSGEGVSEKFLAAFDSRWLEQLYFTDGCLLLSGLVRLGANLVEHPELLSWGSQSLAAVAGAPLRDGDLQYATRLVWAFAVNCSALSRRSPMSSARFREAALGLVVVVRDALTRAFDRRASADISSMLWAVAVFARAEGCGSFVSATPVCQLFQTFLTLVKGRKRPLLEYANSELADVLWAFGRMGLGQSLLFDLAVESCDGEFDQLLAHAGNEPTCLAHLLWSTVALSTGAAGSLMALHVLAMRVVDQLPRLARVNSGADAFVVLLWSLAALDAMTPDTLVDALKEGLGLRREVGALDLVGAWEWALLWELLLLCEAANAGYEWPCDWLEKAPIAWDTDRSLGRDPIPGLAKLLQRLSAALSRLGFPCELEAEVAGCGPKGVVVDAVPSSCLEQQRGEVDSSKAPRWCVEVLTSQEAALSSLTVGAREALDPAVHSYGKSQVKRLYLAKTGWRVVDVSASVLQAGVDQTVLALGVALASGGWCEGLNLPLLETSGEGVLDAGNPQRALRISTSDLPVFDVPIARSSVVGERIHTTTSSGKHRKRERSWSEKRARGSSRSPHPVATKSASTGLRKRSQDQANAKQTTSAKSRRRAIARVSSEASGVPRVGLIPVKTEPEPPRERVICKEEPDPTPGVGLFSMDQGFDEQQEETTPSSKGVVGDANVPEDSCNDDRHTENTASPATRSGVLRHRKN